MNLHIQSEYRKIQNKKNLRIKIFFMQSGILNLDIMIPNQSKFLHFLNKFQLLTSKNKITLGQSLHFIRKSLILTFSSVSRNDEHICCGL